MRGTDDDKNILVDGSSKKYLIVREGFGPSRSGFAGKLWNVMWDGMRQD
jgi:hypothetical protein